MSCNVSFSGSVGTKHRDNPSFEEEIAYLFEEEYKHKLLIGSHGERDLNNPLSFSHTRLFISDKEMGLTEGSSSAVLIGCDNRTSALHLVLLIT